MHTKIALVIGCCVSVFMQASGVAQEPLREAFTLDNPHLVRDSGRLLEIRPFFPPVNFDWALPANTLPSPSTLAWQSRVAPRPAPVSNRVADWSPKADYSWAEIGFTYGRATGKYGGDYKNGYIVGGTGNDHVQISAGALYEDSSVRVWRGR